MAPTKTARTTRSEGNGADDKLSDLSSMAGLEIETSLAANLGGELRALFDPVSSGALPIYFGPLLGRLYLEGL